jgi:GNAT superfamily N-acetyltransferase
MDQQDSWPIVHVRQAQRGDAPLIAAALRAAFEEYAPLYTPEGLNATTPSAERIAARWDEGPVWVAQHHDIVIGTVAVVPRAKMLYVRSMAVTPAARGHGIGDLLLDAVERYAVTHGHTSLLLSTTPFLSRAIRLYERLGFVRSDEGPHELYGTPLFTMTKPLRSR